MTFAWYGHLKNLHDRRWYIAAVASWEIAFSNISCKYRRTESATVNQVSRNSRSPRGDHVIGFRAVRRRVHEEPLKLDYLWAGLCLLGAVYFMFRL
jgi:uncharacterized protein